MEKSAAGWSCRWLLVALALVGSSGLLGACSSGDGGGGGGGGSTTTTTAQATTFTLTVTTNGNGLVTSTPSGIQCGTTCVAAFEQGTQSP